MAHTATLDNKGKTIAVLGNGLSKIFPKENIDLYKMKSELRKAWV